MGLITTERLILPKVEDYLVNQRWKVSREVKLRGRVADIVAVRGDDIAVVEAKGSLGDPRLGLEQALHYRHSANLSYLAIPEDKTGAELVAACKNLGVGLLVVDDSGVKEVVEPRRGPALPSVQRLILNVRPTKSKELSVKSSLEKLFRSRAQVLVLKLLFLNPTSEYHLNDIARKTGLAPSVLVREGSILLGLGLVRRRVQGNLTLYRINKESVIHEELKRIFMKYELLDQLIADQLPVEHVKYALIYGSFAKGTEGEKSDIDLLVIGEVDESTLLRAIGKIEDDTGREINYLLWTEDEFLGNARKHTPLLGEISRTPVMMIVGDGDELKRAVEKRSD